MASSSKKDPSAPTAPLGCDELFPSDCVETKKAFTDFSGKLAGDVSTAKGLLAAAKNAFDGEQEAVCIERKSMAKVLEGQKLYADIWNFQALSVGKDIEQAQETVKKQTDDAAALKKKLDDALGNLKKLKVKLDEVHTKADAFRTLVKNSCNTEEKKKATGIDPAKLADDNLKKWADCSETLAEAADQACETSVHVVGIYAFANVGGVKNYAEVAKAKSDDFNKNIAENLDSSGKMLKISQKSLDEALAKLAVAEANWRRESSKTAAFDDTATDTNFDLDIEAGPTSSGKLPSLGELEELAKKSIA